MSPPSRASSKVCGARKAPSIVMVRRCAARHRRPMPGHRHRSVPATKPIAAVGMVGRCAHRAPPRRSVAHRRGTQVSDLDVNQRTFGPGERGVPTPSRGAQPTALEIRTELVAEQAVENQKLLTATVLVAVEGYRRRRGTSEMDPQVGGCGRKDPQVHQEREDAGAMRCKEADAHEARCPKQ